MNKQQKHTTDVLHDLLSTLYSLYGGSFFQDGLLDSMNTHLNQMFMSERMRDPSILDLGLLNLKQNKKDKSEVILYLTKKQQGILGVKQL